MLIKLRSHLPLRAALLFGLAGLSPLAAGTLGGPVYIGTTSAGCSVNCPSVSLSSFGTTSFGAFNNSGFYGTAQTAWFQDHFGLFARASANLTASSGDGTAYAAGYLFQPVLVPAQNGMAVGDPGFFEPHFHLDGTVNIDWGGTNSPCGSPGCVPSPGGGVTLKWSFGAYNNPQGSGTPLYISLLVNENWQADHLTVPFNRDITPVIPIHFGELFYFASDIRLNAEVYSALPPSQGYAEADFFHTGTLTGTTVLDRFGNPITNPIIQSDNGFDFANPQATATPEPATALLMAGALTALLLCRRWSSLDQRGSAPSAERA